jgi:hypothetical protein
MGTTCSECPLNFKFGVTNGFGGSQYTTCTQGLDGWFETFLIVLPTALITIVLFFCSETVIRSWLRFALFWIPLTVLFSLLTPEYGGGGIVSIDRGTVSFSLSLIYLVLSIIIILTKLYTTRVKK